MRDWNVTGLYTASLWRVLRGPVEIVDPKLLLDDDLTRTRSRAVRIFLTQTEGTHLLFWDGDVEGNEVALANMLAEDVECIAASYPKKRLDKHGRSDELAYNTGGKNVPFAGYRAPVDAIGCGFMLLRRDLLARAWLHYDEELYAIDVDGAHTVMLFHLMFGLNAKGQRVLRPEDYSFCERLRQLDPPCQPYLYTGPGCPLRHAGSHVFAASQIGTLPFALDPPESEYVDPEP